MSTQTLEVMPDAAQDEVQLVVKQNGLAVETAQSLQSSFMPLFTEARSVLEKSRGIVVTDASQKLEIKLARECRLELRRIRVAGDKLRRELKDESLRRGRAIDGFQNILLHITEEEERRLEEQEKFVERKEQERKAALKTAREASLAPYGLDTSFLSLAEMPDETFAQLLENTRAGHEAKLAAARKAEEECIAAENARLKEEARIREENARLQAEAKEREAAARKEREESEKKLAQERELAAKAKAEADAREKAQREAAEAALQAERARLEAIAADERKKAAKAAELAAAKAKQEREARERVERQLKEQREAEEAKQRAAELAARKAAAAPDKEKLAAYAQAVRGLEVPAFSTNAADELAAVIIAQRNKFAAWIEEKAQTL